MRCGGTLWLMGPSGYELRQQDGVVVYYRPPREKPAFNFFSDPPEGEAPSDNGSGASTGQAGSGPLKVARFVLRNPSHFAGFLVDRGITDPVHYILCEDAFEGIAPQVLRADGASQPLIDRTLGAGKACLHELRLEGLVEGDPVALALSPTGHRALIDDVVTFYAGNPDGLFMPWSKGDLIAQLRQDPGFLQGGTKVVADSTDPNGQPFNPVPSDREAVSLDLARPLIPAGPAVDPAPPAPTAILLESGFRGLDPPGCADLVVEVGSWEVTGLWALNPFGKFLQITDVGLRASPAADRHRLRSRRERRVRRHRRWDRAAGSDRVQRVPGGQRGRSSPGDVPRALDLAGTPISWGFGGRPRPRRRSPRPRPRGCRG